MAKYKIYIKKNPTEEYDIPSNYTNGKGIIVSQLGPYGSGNIYIGKANNGYLTQLKSINVDFNMPKPSNPIDVINIKDKYLPAGVQANYSNIGSQSQYFSYIGSGLNSGSTPFGSFVGHDD